MLGFIKYIFSTGIVQTSPNVVQQLILSIFEELFVTDDVRKYR